MGTYVVTGANRGIGLALCQHLVSRGETVVAACRTSSDSLAQVGARVVEGVDVVAPGGLEGLRSALDGAEVDVLINNAGILAGSGDLGALDEESIRRQFEVNGLGPLRVTDALLPVLAADAKVVIVTSRMGSIADNTSGGVYGYRMSKAAVNAAGKSLAVDLAPQGKAVLIVHPGHVRTEMTRNTGMVEPADAAAGIVSRIDETTVANTGRFMHQNGDALPW